MHLWAAVMQHGNTPPCQHGHSEMFLHVQQVTVVGNPQAKVTGPLAGSVKLPLRIPDLVMF